ncbi:MAG: ATP-dependent Clp protease adaptor ClpS [Spirochaetales bacterium]|nr:ATP-dependent Clp protease adaptor ClpS [Spirochaetales bacterium]
MSDFGIQEETKIEDEVAEPPRYKVILHNDDYTTFEFVIYILKIVFLKPAKEAERITRDVHKRGYGVCGIYTCEIAETKVLTVHQLSEEAGFPLRCTMEKD